MNKFAFLLALIALLCIGTGAFFFFYKYWLPNQATEQAKAAKQLERFSTQEDWQKFHTNWELFQHGTAPSWQEFVSYAQGEGARYTCDQPVMKVGDETLYGCDLNAMFIILQPEKYTSAGSIASDDTDLTSAMDALVIDSGLLQKAGEFKLVTLTNLFYNDAHKNTFERYAQLSHLRRDLDLELDKTVDFEAVTIYFHNEINPQIPLDQAKAVAKAKMDVLYARLKNNEITMEQAGKEVQQNKITGDTTTVSLAKLDTVYAGNAYITEKAHRFSTTFFKDQHLDEVIRTLPEGGMSQVELCKDYQFTNQERLANEGNEDKFPLVDSCYVILKVDKINYGLLDPGSHYNSIDEYIRAVYTSKTSKF